MVRTRRRLVAMNTMRNWKPSVYLKVLRSSRTNPRQSERNMATAQTVEPEVKDQPGQENQPPPTNPLDFLKLQGRTKSIVDWLAVAVGIYLLITAVGAIGDGFKLAAGDRVDTLFAFAENPLVALMIGLLATALTQSSSTTTSIVVGLVAGGLPMEIAIPMLMGANIGTTMTNTLVSIGMARDKDVFRRAFAAATVHDFFNLLAVAIFLPLELLFHPLQRISGWLAGASAGSGSGVFGAIFGAIGDFVSALTDPPVELIEAAVGFIPNPWDGVVMVLLGIALILLVINFIGKMLKSLMVGRAERILHSAIGRGPITGVISGMIVTMAVQSSSTTTSLTVPLAGSGAFTLRQIYPFVVGANIGTTITALIAAFGFSGIEAEQALQAAFVHMLYNIFAALIIFGLPFLRGIPLAGARWLARLGAEKKIYVVVWVLGVFIVLPLLLIALTAWL